jgi:hypothetical protein
MTEAGISMWVALFTFVDESAAMFYEGGAVGRNTLRSASRISHTTPMKKGFAEIPLETWEVAVRRHGCTGRDEEECGIDWAEVAKTAVDLSGISSPPWQDSAKPAALAIVARSCET